MPCFFNNCCKSAPSVSFPITANKVVGAPKEPRFKATLAAPPTLISFLCNETIGTGASGEIRSTKPHQ